jgi:hypothetical protein
MDIFDQATEREERDREIAIALAKASAPALPYLGVCHNCGAPTAPSIRFCDADCLQDYEKRERAKRMA